MNRQAAGWTRDFEKRFSFDVYKVKTFTYDNVQSLGYEAITNRKGYKIWQP